MSAPLVSVVVPTYNQEQWIDDAVTSVAQQSYDRLEVIVADDASEDGTPARIAGLAERYPGRVLPLLGRERVGINENWGRGIEACRGKYIAVCAGDDTLLPGKVERQVEWLEADERRVLCAHDIEIFSGTGEVIGLWSDHFPLRSGTGPRHLIREGCVIPTLSVMVRASALPPGGFDGRLRIRADWKLWIDCLLGGGHYGYVPGVLARYRRHPASISSMLDADWQGKLATFEDSLVALAITEAGFPEFHSDVAYQRADLYWRQALAALERDDSRVARKYLRASIGERPPSSPAVLSTITQEYLPEPVFRAVRAVWRWASNASVNMPGVGR